MASRCGSAPASTAAVTASDAGPAEAGRTAGARPGRLAEGGPLLVDRREQAGGIRLSDRHA